VNANKSDYIDDELCFYLGNWWVAIPLNKIEEMVECWWRVKELDVAVGPAHMDSF
jgi:hypothetical protein